MGHATPTTEPAGSSQKTLPTSKKRSSPRLIQFLLLAALLTTCAVFLVYGGLGMTDARAIRNPALIGAVGAVVVMDIALLFAARRARPARPAGQESASSQASFSPEREPLATQSTASQRRVMSLSPLATIPGGLLVALAIVLLLASLLTQGGDLFLSAVILVTIGAPPVVAHFAMQKAGRLPEQRALTYGIWASAIVASAVALFFLTGILMGLLGGMYVDLGGGRDALVVSLFYAVPFVIGTAVVVWDLLFLEAGAAGIRQAPSADLASTPGVPLATRDASPAIGSAAQPRPTLLLLSIAGLLMACAIIAMQVVRAAVAVADVMRPSFVAGVPPVRPTPADLVLLPLGLLLPLTAAFPVAVISATILRTKRIPRSQSLVAAAWTSVLASGGVLLLQLLINVVPTLTARADSAFTLPNYTLPIFPLVSLPAILALDVVFLRAVAAERAATGA